MHDVSVSERSTLNPSTAEGTNCTSDTGRYSVAMSNDCTVAAQQSSCSVKSHEDYDQQKTLSGGNVGGQYSDFSARQLGGNTANGDLSGGSGASGNTVANLSHKANNGRSASDMCGIPDDSKLLANPKGIIKSFLPQAAAFDSLKFDAYRELCLAHADEYYKNQKGGSIWATCHVCNTTHPHWNTLQRHLQTHIDFRPFSCDQCGRTFYSQSKLKRHQVIHSDVKPYKCPVCDRRLGRTEHLKRHLLVHTDDKPYGCSSCAHTTKRLDGIRRHIKRKHGITGAEIVVLAGNMRAPGDGGGHTLADIRQVMSAIDESEQRQKPLKAKKKKKKKKKTAGGSENNPGGMPAESIDAMAKEFGGNLLEVAARFGLSDLRLTPSTGGNSEHERSGFDSVGAGSSGAGGVANHAKDGKNFHDSVSGGGSGASGGGGSSSHVRRAENATSMASEEIKPSWDGGLLLSGLPSQQMHLLYHSLARSTHPAAPPGIHGDGSMGGVATPCNLVTNDSNANLRQASFCHDRTAAGLPMSSPVTDHTFIMNSSSVPMRYLPTVGAAGHDGGAARHVNPMLFSPTRNPTRNLGHFGAAADMNMPTEAMISQYIQSQQRFAPPVWGFANPNYHNY